MNFYVRKLLVGSAIIRRYIIKYIISFSEGVRHISNQLSITTKMDLTSQNLIEEASSLGLYKAENGEFSFAKVFGKDPEDKTIVELTRKRLSGGEKLLKEYSKDGKLNAPFSIVLDSNLYHSLG